MSTGSDFSTLPDVVWVKVMTVLGLGDRNRVSRTCSRLNEVFHHPSLWHTVRIFLQGDGDFGDNPTPKTRRIQGIFMPERYTAMIRAFGAFFQDVELIILGNVREIKPCCEELITQLALNCRLESLTLQIGEPVNRASTRKPPTESSLKVVASLVTEAFRLRSFALTSWPIYQNHNGYNILQCMRENDKIKGLEKLRLFEKDVKPDSWFPRNINLPSLDDVLTTVAHFHSLTFLGLHADLLTNALLMELSNLKWFNNLSLLLLQSNTTILESVSSTAWRNLVAKHPQLKVSVTVGNSLPSHKFIQFFKPEIPLVAISFARYSQYQPHIIEHISGCYLKTIMTFQDFGDGLTNGDSVIQSLVTRCSQMNHFVYFGQLKDSTVVALADLRKQNWKTFQVKLQNNPFPDDDDEDNVLGATSTGSFYIKAHQPNAGFYHTDESEALRGQTKESVKDYISKVLQRKWLPMSEN